jgi:hypothetical protein
MCLARCLVVAGCRVTCLARCPVVAMSRVLCPAVTGCRAMLRDRRVVVAGCRVMSRVLFRGGPAVPGRSPAVGASAAWNLRNRARAGTAWPAARAPGGTAPWRMVAGRVPARVADALGGPVGMATRRTVASTVRAPGRRTSAPVVRVAGVFRRSAGPTRAPMGSAVGRAPHERRLRSCRPWCRAGRASGPRPYRGVPAPWPTGRAVRRDAVRAAGAHNPRRAVRTSRAREQVPSAPGRCSVARGTPVAASRLAVRRPAGRPQARRSRRAGMPRVSTASPCPRGRPRVAPATTGSTVSVCLPVCRRVALATMGSTVSVFRAVPRRVRLTVMWAGCRVMRYPGSTVSVFRGAPRRVPPTVTRAASRRVPRPVCPTGGSTASLCPLGPRRVRLVSTAGPCRRRAPGGTASPARPTTPRGRAGRSAVPPVRPVRRGVRLRRGPGGRPFPVRGGPGRSRAAPPVLPVRSRVRRRPHAALPLRLRPPAVRPV